VILFRLFDRSVLSSTLSHATPCEKRWPVLSPAKKSVLFSLFSFLALRVFLSHIIAASDDFPSCSTPSAFLAEPPFFFLFHLSHFIGHIVSGFVLTFLFPARSLFRGEVIFS